MQGRNSQGLVALAFLAALQPACVSATRSVVVRVRDPDQVALSAPSRAGAEKQVLDGSKRDGVVAAGAFETGGVSSVVYDLRAIRGEDGSIALSWARPPIINGERQLLLRGDRSIVVPDTDDASFVVPSTGALPPSMKLPCEVWLAQESASEGGFIGYSAQFAPLRPPNDAAPYGAPLRVPLLLETPWSNVVEVRSTSEPKRRGAIIGALVTTLATGALATFMILVANGVTEPVNQANDNIGPKIIRGMGWGFAGVGATVDVLLLPTILAPSSKTVVYPGR
jgi:hypothetical protein